MSILSKLFPGNDQVAQLESAVAENDSIRAELEAAQAKITELSGLSAIIAEKDAEILHMTDQMSAKDEKIKLFVSEISELQAKVENIPSVVTETLASIGQPEALPIEQATNAPADMLAQYEAMPEGAEKRKFLLDNAIQLRNLAKQKSVSNP